MYATPYDNLTLKEFGRPYDHYIEKCYKLFEEHEAAGRPGWKNVGKIELDWARYIWGDIDPILNKAASFMRQPNPTTEIPQPKYIRECNLYDPKTPDPTLFDDTVKVIKNFYNDDRLIRVARVQLKSNETTFTHVDQHRQLQEMTKKPILVKDVRIGFIFLEDWVYGQAYFLGNSVLTHWKQGDVVEFWPWLPHHTVNNSNVERNALVMVMAV
jgi:hypothetical protein